MPHGFQLQFHSSYGKFIMANRFLERFRSPCRQMSVISIICLQRKRSKPLAIQTIISLLCSSKTGGPVQIPRFGLHDPIHHALELLLIQFLCGFFLLYDSLMRWLDVSPCCPPLVNQLFLLDVSVQHSQSLGDIAVHNYTFVLSTLLAGAVRCKGHKTGENTQAILHPSICWAVT